MYNLTVPEIASAYAYNTAVSTIRVRTRQDPYTAAASIVQVRCDAFDQLCVRLAFDQAESADFDVSGLAANAMVKLYDEQFSKRVGTEEIRNAIKNAAPNELCPYCGEGQATELDHYLPKSHFAGTSVHPANLVPACHDCNFEKRAYIPGPSTPAVLHPYFDTAFTTPWLSATVAKSSLQMPVIKFSVKLTVPDPPLEARLNAHLRVFDLRRRFSVWAAQSLTNFDCYLAGHERNSMTLDEARRDLQRTELQQSGGRINSWEGAAHRAMRESDWYLTGYLNLS